MKSFAWLVLISLLTACASKPPVDVRHVPEPDVSLAAVLANPQDFVGSEVRWGGEIVSVENRADVTWVEIIGRELSKDVRPRVNGASEGRFIASFTGFADPEVYKQGYLLTVVGRLAPPVSRPIGEYPYTFPRVNVSGSHLWKIVPAEYPSSPWRYDPGWYDPGWYGPGLFHPGHYRPYYPHHW